MEVDLRLRAAEALNDHHGAAPAVNDAVASPAMVQVSVSRTLSELHRSVPTSVPKLGQSRIIPHPTPTKFVRKNRP